MNVRPDGEIERSGSWFFIAEVDLPPNALSPNARVHWAAKARTVKGYRRQCATVFRQARHPLWIPGPVEIEIEYRAFRGCGGYHPKDEDNARAACKSLLDGMRDADVIWSDAKSHVRWGAFRLITTRRAIGDRGAGITVLLRRLT